VLKPIDTQRSSRGFGLNTDALRPDLSLSNQSIEINHADQTKVQFNTQNDNLTFLQAVDVNP